MSSLWDAVFIQVLDRTGPLMLKLSGPPYILIEKFGVHVRDLPNFELQVNGLSDTLLRNSPRFWMRSDKEREYTFPDAETQQSKV
jgi:hypothetical protein